MERKHLLSLLFALFVGAAFSQAGTLDPSFSTDGLISTDIAASTFDRAGAVAMSNGRVVAVGTSGYDKGYDFGVARYLNDGTPDASFSFNGTDFTTVAFGNDLGTAVVAMADGRILIGGYAACSEGNCFAMVRYMEDGSLDPSFGSAGIVTTEFSGGYTLEAKAIAIQADGKILLAGGGVAGFAVVRYLEDGTVDTGFGTNGLATCAFTAGNDRATGMAVLADGRIVLAGYSSGLGNDSIAVTRMLDDGTIDNTFGNGGRISATIPNVNTIGQGMALGPNGEIVVAGYFVPMFAVEPTAMVACFTPDGSLDTGFNGTGMRDIGVSGSVSSMGNGVVVQPDGKVVVCGAVTNATSDLMLTRLNADGSVDASFNTTGLIITDLTGTADRAHAVTLQDDGRIVVVGETDAGPQDRNFVVARYLNDIGTSIEPITAADPVLGVFPQPMTEHGVLTYTLATDDRITIELHDALGANVRTIVPPRRHAAGTYREVLDLPSTLAAGSYFLLLRGEHIASTMKLIVE